MNLLLTRKYIIILLIFIYICTIHIQGETKIVVTSIVSLQFKKYFLQVHRYVTFRSFAKGSTSPCNFV